MYLNNVFYVPSFNQNIFSVEAASERGALIKFSQNSASVTNGNGDEFNIKKHGRLYYLNKCITRNKPNIISKRGINY